MGGQLSLTTFHPNGSSDSTKGIENVVETPGNAYNVSYGKVSWVNGWCMSAGRPPAGLRSGFCAASPSWALQPRTLLQENLAH